MKKPLFITFVFGFAFGVLISCNKDGGHEVPPEPKPEPEPETETYATFTINMQNAGTKAFADFNPDMVGDDDASDARIAPGDLYILVFNNDNILEYKAEVDSIPHTALITSGAKRVFVLANLGSTASHVMGNLRRVNPETLDATDITYADLKVGATTLNDLYAIAFDAGTPQGYDVDKSGPRTFSIAPLFTRIDETHGLPMTNDNRYTFTLNPDVTKIQAETPGTPATDGSETYNRFAINLDYLCAKVRFVMNPEVLFIYTTSQGDTLYTSDLVDISDPFYTIKNLPKYFSLFPNVLGGPPGRFYYYSIYQNRVQERYFQELSALFQNHFDKASNAGAQTGDPTYGGVPALTEGGSFLFVPENPFGGGADLGVSTCVIVNLTYKPKYIIKSVTWDAQRATIDYSYDSWDALSAVGANILENGNQYFYRRGGLTGDDINEYFANKQLLADALWMTTYGDPAAGSGYSADAALELLGEIGNHTYQKYIGGPARFIWTFTDAQSWYRFNIHPGVYRGLAYTVVVKQFGYPEPGKPEEMYYLLDEPGLSTGGYFDTRIDLEVTGWVP